MRCDLVLAIPLTHDPMEFAPRMSNICVESVVTKASHQISTSAVPSTISCSCEPQNTHWQRQCWLVSGRIILKDFAYFLCSGAKAPTTRQSALRCFPSHWERNSNATMNYCHKTSWLKKLTVFWLWRYVLLRHRVQNSARSTRTTTLEGSQNDEPPLPITPEAGGSLPDDGLMIGGPMGGVGLLFVIHCHLAQASVVNIERAESTWSTSDMVQQPGISNGTADSSNDRYHREMTRPSSWPGFC